MRIMRKRLDELACLQGLGVPSRSCPVPAVQHTMRRHCLWLLMVASAAEAADPSPVDEIAARSGLPASEVAALLGSCDSSQTSMNVCAWRDQIVAERELQRVVDEQMNAHPERKSVLRARIEKWRKARDTSCEESARKEWGDGSMRPAAQAVCATASTKKMTQRLSTSSHRTS